MRGRRTSFASASPKPSCSACWPARSGWAPLFDATRALLPRAANGLEVEALRAVGARRVAIAAPYTETLTRKFAEYFTAAGLEVAATRCLGIERPVEMALLDPQVPADLARAVHADAAGVDAVHLTCPRWPTVGSLARLEQELGVPVTSSSQSVLYGTLSRLGIRDDIRGFGSLLERLPAVPARVPGGELGVARWPGSGVRARPPMIPGVHSQ